MTAILIPPSSANWEKFGARISEIERSVFGARSLDEAMMQADLNDPRTNLVLLKDGEEIVGFTYATPEEEGVARIVDTVILAEYQHKGYVALLMTCLEERLRAENYRFVTRDAMVDNGYAEKIERNYRSRIAETREIAGEWGKQIYFKIRL